MLTAFQRRSISASDPQQGLVSGHTLDWPKRFQQGMYAADWQNGRILLVDLIPVGASYRGEYELLLEGAPLNICDMEVSMDGNLTSSPVVAVHSQASIA